MCSEQKHGSLHPSSLFQTQINNLQRRLIPTFVNVVTNSKTNKVQFWGLMKDKKKSQVEWSGLFLGIKRGG